jgi:hypothetical protein
MKLRAQSLVLRDPELVRRFFGLLPQSRHLDSLSIVRRERARCPKRGHLSEPRRSLIDMMNTHVEDYAAVASRMRNRALGGEFRGTMFGSDAEYMRRCRVRISDATLIFTRDNHAASGDALMAALSSRCWHLSISGVNSAARDAWLAAFYANDIGRLWVELQPDFDPPVSHWRLLCDAAWSPLSISRGTSSLLRAAGWRPVGEVIAFRDRDAA